MMMYGGNSGSCSSLRSSGNSSHGSSMFGSSATAATTTRRSSFGGLGSSGRNSSHGSSSSSCLPLSDSSSSLDAPSSFGLSYYGAASSGTDAGAFHYYKDKRVASPRHLQVDLSGRLGRLLQSFLREPWRLVGLLLVVGAVGGCRNRAHKAWLLREFRAQSYAEALGNWEELREDHRELTQEFEDLYRAQAKWEQRDAAWRTHVQRLHNFTQRESRRAVLDKFGPGPHHVSIKVVLPDDSPAPIAVNPETQLVEQPPYDPKNVRSFQVELAPLADMPHATHLFLEQVAHGLWNRAASFYVNHEHVLQAGPRTREARQHFTDYGLEKMAFPEYSHNFPHKPWTLGFAGRPGGPSFYINKINNEEDHGPFGQEHHALDEFADACFAKVVSGWDTLREIVRQTSSQRHTKIVGMEVIAWNDHWTDGNDAHWRKAHETFDDVATDAVTLEEDAVAAPSGHRPPGSPAAIDDVLLQAAPDHIERHHAPPAELGEPAAHHAAQHRQGFHQAHAAHHATANYVQQ